MSFKLKQRIAAFVGAFALVGVMPVTSHVNQVCAVETAATECKANLNITIDSNKYLIGDTVTARLYISDLEDEANADVQIAAMEAHLIFDNNKLEFLPNETEFMESLKSSINASQSSESYLGVSDKHPERIVAYFAYNSGGYQLEPGLKDLMVAEFKFKVKATAKKGEKIKVDFDKNPINDGSEELRYENVLMRPLTENIKPADTLFKLGMVSHITEAELFDDVVFVPSDCIYNEASKVIRGNVDIAVSDKYNSAWVVVKLYDSTGLTKAVQYRDVKTLESRSWDFEFNNITSMDNLKIKYFLWESPTNMLPIAEMYDLEIYKANE